MKSSDTDARSRRKILIVGNIGWYLYNFRSGLGKILKENGFDVVFAAKDDGYGHLVRKDNIKFIPLGVDRKGVNPFRDFFLFWELFRLYKREKPFMVVHYTIKPNIYGSMACRVLGVPSIAVVTGLGYVFIKRKGVIPAIAKMLYRITLNTSHKVVFLTDEDLRIFIRLKLIKENKGMVLPDPVDSERFAPEECEANNTREKGKKIFLLMARMLWDKGIGEFVKAAQLLKDKYPRSEFWLLGPIDQGNPSFIPMNTINNWQSVGNIRYHGMADDVRSFISNSDVVVLPSYREGTPRALLEAMAMARPVIATKTVGCKNLVEDGINGFLVPKRDAGSLAEIMSKMIEMTEDELAVMGKEGRMRVLRDFDEKVIIGKFIDIIEGLAENEKRRD